MLQPVDIAITGSGSLATEILKALVIAAKTTPRVAVLGRDAARLELLTRSTTELAAASGSDLQIMPLVIDWSNQAQICQSLAALRPRVLVHTASLQSPWKLHRDDRWSRLVQLAGFGFTLPLQAVLASRIGRAIISESLKTHFINACYPDAVNRLLVASGLPVIGGLGNVAILAALLASGRSLQPGRRLRLIAHHAHVAAVLEHRELNDRSFAAWIDEEPWDAEARRWFRRAHLPSNLNHLAAAAAAPMLLALIGHGPRWEGHAPGPLGLPGGYPVVVSPGGFELDLPRKVSPAEATALNMAAALSDGIVVKDNGEAALAEYSKRALKKMIPSAVDRLSSWHATQVEGQASYLLDIRERLSS